MTIDDALVDRVAVALERIADAHDQVSTALELIENRLSAISDGLVGNPVQAACAHPESEREDRGSTMGHERWRCTVCGFEKRDES